MSLFTLQNNRLVIDPESLAVPEFRKLWDRDKSKDKDIARQELSYVWFLCNYKSVYLNYPPSQREAMVKKDYIESPKWQPDSMVALAMEKYRESQNTPSMRYLQANIRAMESTIDYLENIDFNLTDKAGRPIYKITEVTAAIAKAGDIISSLEKLQNKVEKEMAVNRQKGEQVNNLYED